MGTADRQLVDSQGLDLANHDLKACAALMEGGSKTFFAASRLLPQRVRAGAIALYAFCRVADDLVDEAAPGARVPITQAIIAPTVPATRAP